MIFFSFAIGFTQALRTDPPTFPAVCKNCRCAGGFSCSVFCISYRSGRRGYRCQFHSLQVFLFFNNATSKCSILGTTVVSFAAFWSVLWADANAQRVAKFQAQCFLQDSCRRPFRHSAAFRLSFPPFHTLSSQEVVKKP